MPNWKNRRPEGWNPDCEATLDGVNVIEKTCDELMRAVREVLKAEYADGGHGNNYWSADALMAISRIHRVLFGRGIARRTK